jgi:hypothetical protein
VLAAHRGTAPAHRPLGSVTYACLHAATVPVVVVPARLIQHGPRTELPSDLGAYSPAFSGW